MGKFVLYKEAFISTILIILTVFLVNFFPLKYELVKPIKQDFGDFDIFDLHYSGHQAGSLDDRIVLVQIGDNRKEIREQLAKLSACKPSVIGIDVDFRSASGDPAADSALQKQIHEMPEVVTGFRMIMDEGSNHLKRQANYFDGDSATRNRSGYFNFIGEEISVVRQYAPFYKLNGVTEYALSSRVLEKYDPVLFQKLKKRHNKIELINYSGNTEHYRVITKEELWADTANKLEKDIRGKIVLLGILYTEPPLLMDDIHFTPLNRKVTGKSLPDMYGVVIHANVLSMLLSGKYMKMKSANFSYLVTFVIVFLIMWYQLRLYKRKIHPAHWKLILFQLLAIIVLVYLFFLLFSYFHIKVELLPVIIAIVLSVEVFGPYRKLAEWLNKKMTWNRPVIKKQRQKK